MVFSYSFGRFSEKSPTTPTCWYETFTWIRITVSYIRLIWNAFSSLWRISLRKKTQSQVMNSLRVFNRWGVRRPNQMEHEKCFCCHPFMPASNERFWTPNEKPSLAGPKKKSVSLNLPICFWPPPKTGGFFWWNCRKFRGFSGDPKNRWVERLKLVISTGPGGWKKVLTFRYGLFKSLPSKSRFFSMWEKDRTRHTGPFDGYIFQKERCYRDPIFIQLLFV